MDIPTFYSALLFVLAVILELCVLLTDIFKTQDKDKEIRDKNRKFSSIPFICLAAMSGIVWLMSSIADIVNFRVAWIVNELNGKYEINFKPMIVSNEYHALFDTLFILFIFYAMVIYLRRVNYRRYPGHEEGFYFNGERSLDVCFLPFAFPHIYIFFMLIPLGFGISMLLVALSWIPCGAISYVFWKNRLRKS